MILQLGSSIWLHLPWVIASPSPGIAHSWRRALIICHRVSTPEGILQIVELWQRNESMWLDMVGWWCWWWNMMDMCVKRVTTDAIGWRTSWISRLVIWFLGQWMILCELPATEGQWVEIRDVQTCAPWLLNMLSSKSFNLWPLGLSDFRDLAWQWPKTTQPQGHRRRAVQRAPVGSHCPWPHLQAAPSALEVAEPRAGWRWWGQRAPRKANKLGKIGENDTCWSWEPTQLLLFLMCLLLFPNVKMVWRRCRATKKWVNAGGNSTVPEVKDPFQEGYECSYQCNRFVMNTNNTGNPANPAIRSFTSNKQNKWNVDKSANPSNCLIFIHFRPNIHPSPKFSNTRHLLQSIEQISTLHCDILRPAVPLQLRLDREHSVGATVRGHDAHRGIEVVPQQKADDLGICIQSLDEHSYSLLKSSSPFCPGFQKMSVVTAHLICNRTWYTGDHRSKTCIHLLLTADILIYAVSATPWMSGLEIWIHLEGIHLHFSGCSNAKWGMSMYIFTLYK